MSPGELLTQLEDVARRLDVDVRFESLARSGARRGGLCKVHGRAVILVDSAAAVVDQVATLEAALRKLDLDGIFVPPFVRARIEGRPLRAGPAIKKAAMKPAKATKRS